MTGIGEMAWRNVASNGCCVQRPGTQCVLCCNNSRSARDTVVFPNRTKKTKQILEIGCTGSAMSKRRINLTQTGKSGWRILASVGPDKQKRLAEVGFEWGRSRYKVWKLLKDREGLWSVTWSQASSEFDTGRHDNAINKMTGLT